MSFVKDWNQKVTTHHKQSESKIINNTNDDFWEDKVEGFVPPELPDYNDPTLSFLQTHLTPKSSVLDLGGGAGRLSIPLAQKNHIITIVDSSLAMINAADSHVKYLNLNNVTTFHSQWENFPNNKYDHIFSTHVLYGISDISEFISKIHSSTINSAIIIMYDKSPQSHLADLWNLFYSEQRINLPGMNELTDVIKELGIKYEFYNIEQNDLPVFDDFELMLKSITSQMFVTPTNENLKHISKILNDYMKNENNQFIFPSKFIRKLQAIIIKK